MNQNKTRRKKSIARRASVKVELVIMALVLFFIAPPALAQTPVAKVAITYVETAPQKNGSIDVSAFVSVTDETGRPVSGLTAGDFILTENDQPIQSQSLSVAPATNSLTAVLLIDASARMADVGPDRVRTLDAAKDSAVGFIDALTDGDMVAVYEYDRQIRTLQTMTYDHNYAIDRGVNRLNASQSESACLFDALLAVQQELIQDSPDGQQAVVVITGSSTGAADGACGGTALDDLLNLETKTGNPIPVYSVGIGEAVDSDDLEQLSSRTGGQSFAALDAKSLIDQVLLVSTQLRINMKSTTPLALTMPWLKSPWLSARRSNRLSATWSFLRWLSPRLPRPALHDCSNSGTVRQRPTNRKCSCPGRYILETDPTFH